MRERQQTRVPLGEPWPGGHLSTDPLRESLARMRPGTSLTDPTTLEGTLRAAFPLRDFNEECELSYVSSSLVPPTRTAAECRHRGDTYADTLRATFRLVTLGPADERTGLRPIKTMIEEEATVAALPRLTPEGTFVIKGVDRVLVRQLAESPGVRFLPTKDGMMRAEIRPRRGFVLGFEFHRGLVRCRLGQKKKRLPVTTLLRACGLTGEDILTELCPSDTIVRNDDGSWSRKLDLDSLAGERARHDLVIGGQVLVKKHRKFTRVVVRKLRELGIERLPVDEDALVGRVLTRDAVSERTGEVLREHSDALRYGDLADLAEQGITSVEIVRDDDAWVSDAIPRTLRADRVTSTEEAHLVIYHLFHGDDAPTADTAEHFFRHLFLSHDRYELSPAGRASIDRKLHPHGVARSVWDRDEDTRHLLVRDLLETLRELLRRKARWLRPDDLDHTDEAVVNDGAALVADALRVGLDRLGRVVRERLSMWQDPTTLNIDDLIAPRSVQPPIDELFQWSRVSERATVTNPLAALSQRRRLATVEPDRTSPRLVSYRQRPRHDTHLGTFCPVEQAWPGGVTPALALGIDERGRLVSGYAGVESFHKGYLPDPGTPPPQPWEMLGLGASLVPFLAHTDPEAARAGIANMRVALPPLHPTVARVATGLEAEVAHSDGLSVLATSAGRVVVANAREVIVAGDNGVESIHMMRVFEPTPRGATIHQRPAVRAGDRVEAGELLASGPGVVAGEMALGHDLLTALLPTFGPTLVVSERVVRDGLFASVQLREFRVQAAKVGVDEEAFSRDIPDADDDEIAALDEQGLVRVGQRVRGGDILIGKVMTGPLGPRVETDIDPASVRHDRSLRMTAGHEGVVIAAWLDDRHSATLSRRTHHRATVVVATLQPLAVGDLLGSRHGDRGTVARIAPVEDMPVLPDGRPVDLVLNPALLIEPGAPGFFFEMLAGSLGLPVLVPPFSRVTEGQLRASLGHDGAVPLRDGRTGELLDQRVTVGHVHFMRLPPLAADAMQARSIGDIDPRTGEPVATDHRSPGQLLDEDAIAAIAAHGAAHTLREVLGIKSDPNARESLPESFAALDELPTFVPRGLDALIRELRASALDVQAADESDLAATEATRAGPPPPAPPRKKRATKRRV